MSETERTTPAPQSATPDQQCPVFAWCVEGPADHADQFHTGAPIDTWATATGNEASTTGDLSVYVEAFRTEDGVLQRPTVMIKGRLDRDCQDLAAVNPTDARRLAHAMLGAAAVADGVDDPVGTDNDECVHPWCEYGGDGHRDHESAGVYVAATGGHPALDIDGTRFPALRVFLSAVDARDTAVGLFIGGLPDKREEEVHLTVAEARQLRDALDVMLRHAEG